MEASAKPITEYTVDSILNELDQLADPDKVLFKQQKFGVVANNALGVYMKDIKQLAKEIGTNSALAVELFNTGVYEARLLCSKLFNPKELTDELLEQWVVTFENWEVCDSFCMGLVAKSDFALPKIKQWSKRKPEFERRAAFATMAAYCMADKKGDNTVFEQFFLIIKDTANDDRVYVKKAVNWALRNIGKRNTDLNKAAIEVAKELLDRDNKAAQWIAKDAIKELAGEKVRMSNYPRAIYRK